jgi:hypothetical protein
VHQHEVGLEQRFVRGIVKIDVERLAVGTPVTAKIQNDAFMLRRGRL